MKECKSCLKLKTAFDDAKHDLHGNLCSTYSVMRELHDQKKLILYMSDCSFENWLAEIDEERHFTYNLYLQCCRCKKVYRLGVCVRGKPLYQIFDEKPDKEEFKRLCLRDDKKFYEERAF